MGGVGMEIGHAGLHGEVVDEGVGSVGQMEWLGLVMKHRIALPASHSLAPYVQGPGSVSSECSACGEAAGG
jgi:hypothetical protein